MKTTIKFFALITACVFFTSCQQENVQPQPTPVRKDSSVIGSASTEKGDHLDRGKTEAVQESKE
jgi:hypothetical protein